MFQMDLWNNYLIGIMTIAILNSWSFGHEIAINLDMFALFIRNEQKMFKLLKLKSIGHWQISLFDVDLKFDAYKL